MNSIRLYKKISSLNTSIIRGEEILNEVFCKMFSEWDNLDTFEKLEFNIVYESLYHTVELEKSKKNIFKRRLTNKLKTY